MPARIYTDRDADLRLLKGKTCAIIGYGSQGQAFALNLRDSGLRVVVGLHTASKSITKARLAGFEVHSNTDAAQKADFIVMAAPDMRQPDIFESDLKPRLHAGQTLVFCHGFCIHTGLIKPPPGVDAILVAPKGPGTTLRQLFLEGKGLPGLIATHPDASAQAKRYALALAKAVGLTRAGVLETTFREETETDLFGEQAVTCGGCTALILAGFETLVEAGYQPEVAYMECLYELKAIVDLIHQHGINGMRRRISETARYGDVTRGPRVISEHTRVAMRELLSEIQSGAFVRELMAESKAGYPQAVKLLEGVAEHPIEKIGKKLCTRMKRLLRLKPRAVQKRKAPDAKARIPPGSPLRAGHGRFIPNEA